MELSRSEEATSPSATEKFPIFKEPEDSLPCSQKRANLPYPEPDEASP
jgi:hypothetical protein